MVLSSKLGRALLAGVPQLVALVPAGLAMVLTWNRLPSEMASRFDLSGNPIDSMGRIAMLATIMGLGVFLALTFGLVNASPQRSGAGRTDTARLFVALAWGTAGLVGALLLGVVLANVGAPGYAEVALGPATVLYGFGVAVVTGCIGYLLAPPSPVISSESAAAPPMELGDTERLSWARPIGSPWLLASGAVLVLVGLVIAVIANPVPGGIVVVTGVLLLLTGTAMVTVDRRGLTVAFSALRWPRVRVDVAEIVSAEAADISLAQFGGIGYRVIPGGSGVILRSGQALVVRRNTGKSFTVTVPDADTAARVLNGLVGQTR